VYLVGRFRQWGRTAALATPTTLPDKHAIINLSNQFIELVEVSFLGWHDLDVSKTCLLGASTENLGAHHRTRGSRSSVTF